MWYKIYVKNGKSTTININNQCVLGNPPPNGVPLVKYHLQSLTNQELVSHGSYGNQLPMQTQSNAVTVNHVTSYSCSKNISFSIGANKGILSTVQGHDQYRVFLFWAEVAPGAASGQEQYFDVTSTNGSNNNSFVGMAKTISDNTLFDSSRGSTIYKSSGTWSASVMFAPRCDDPAGVQKSIQVYDADNGVYQFSPYMNATLERYNGSQWNTGSNWPKTYDDTQVQGNKPLGQSGSTGTLNFTANHGYLYRINFIGSTYPNTIQVILPYDQFDASSVVRGSCAQFSCTATATNANTVKVVVKNDGQYAEGKGYQVRERYYPVGNAVTDNTTGHNYNQAWPNPNGFTTNIPVGHTRTSTTNRDPANNPYFYHPAGSSVEFELYDDTGGGADQIKWDNNNGNCDLIIPITVTCSIAPIFGAVPHQGSNSFYDVTLNATGSGPGGNYTVTMTATPGAYITTPPNNPQTVHINDAPGAPPGVNYHVYFGGYLDYQGSYSGIVKDSSQNFVAACPSVTSTPIVAPYFQVWQNDAAAGGGFNDIAGCANSYPGYVSPSTASARGLSNSNFYGGIRANNSTTQAKTDFGAVALGVIPNPAGEGFISLNNTLFANSLSGPILSSGISGYFNSSSANPNHCAYDFYDKTKISPVTTTPGSLQNDIINNCPATAGDHRCQFKMSGAQTIGAITIPNSTQVTIYVSGDLTINGNITYNPATFDPTDRTTIPYLTIITHGGDITLGPNVTQLDGLYVAQPIISGASVNGGSFKTCNGQCPRQLVVNGAVIAQRVQLLRAHGSSQPLSGPPAANIGNAPAEIFNFTPDMILGYPMFNPLPQGNPSLFSLPPVF